MVLKTKSVRAKQLIGYGLYHSALQTLVSSGSPYLVDSLRRCSLRSKLLAVMLIAVMVLSREFVAVRNQPSGAPMGLHSLGIIFLCVIGYAVSTIKAKGWLGE